MRAAGSVFLLCLVKYAPEHPLVQARLRSLQQHFTYMLSEKNELMQEVGSKGLALVYELCVDDEIKDQLIATLAKGLMSGTIEAPDKGIPVKDQGPLFDENAIKVDDKLVSGGSLTTYKELCTLATELGQPELIYRFMNLAGSNKVWNSRRGAAFGVSLIATQAADRLRPHLPTLLPKLYRYQFDPNERIQEAMGGLWQTLVADPEKAKTEYLSDMFKELLPGIGSRLWRVREASCLALADLLAGRRYESVKDYLVETYRLSMRAMDDIKETVRVAGLTLNRAGMSSLSPSYMPMHTIIIIHAYDNHHHHTCICIPSSSYMPMHTIIIIHAYAYHHHHTCPCTSSSYLYAPLVHKET